MKKIKKSISIILFFITTASFGQISNKQIAQNVFNNITNSVGNNFPSPPKLHFETSENKVAYITNGNVYLEIKALDILCKQPNKEDALAYILSHELAHHYLNHSWMKNIGFTYTSKIKNELEINNEVNNLRKTEEIQADLYGGFFSKIAGYNSLAIGQDIINLIYKNYNLPENIIGYPSLTDRKNIVLDNLNELNKLSFIFKMGNLMVVTEEYSNASKCYNHILNKNFTSREIYNNLGAVYLKMAINFDDDLSKYSFPILFEQNTRSTTKEITRGIDELSETKTRDTIMYYLNLADDSFNRSALLDKNFIKPKANLLISELIKTKNYRTKLDIGFNKKLEQLNLNISDENDIKLLSFYLGLVPEIDEDEKLKKATIISENNNNIFHNIKLLDSVENNKNKNEYSNLINDLEFTGLKKVDKTISTGDGIKIKISNSVDTVIYEYNNDKYFVSVLINNLSKNEGLNENSNFNDVITKHGNPSSIYKLNNLLYLNYKNNKFVIVLFENKLIEIIYYN
jgi:hypothetical protein